KYFAQTSHKSSIRPDQSLENCAARICVTLRVIQLSGLAGRQGFEPRYRGPESGECVAVDAVPLWFVPVGGVTASVRSGLLNVVLVENVSLCLRSRVDLSLSRRQRRDSPSEPAKPSK